MVNIDRNSGHARFILDRPPFWRLEVLADLKGRADELVEECA